MICVACGYEGITLPERLSHLLTKTRPPLDTDGLVLRLLRRIRGPPLPNLGRRRDHQVTEDRILVIGGAASRPHLREKRPQARYHLPAHKEFQKLAGRFL